VGWESGREYSGSREGGRWGPSRSPRETRETHLCGKEERSGEGVDGGELREFRE